MMQRSLPMTGKYYIHSFPRLRRTMHRPTKSFLGVCVEKGLGFAPKHAVPACYPRYKHEPMLAIRKLMKHWRMSKTDVYLKRVPSGLT